VGNGGMREVLSGIRTPKGFTITFCTRDFQISPYNATFQMQINKINSYQIGFSKV
jgi:hypothetical protein